MGKRRPEMGISGKRALVTGAGTGIGQCVAVELARKGVKVAIHYNRSDSGALETQQQISEFGGESCIVQADVSNMEQIESMMKKTAEQLGGLDILVNNAALQLNYDFFDYDENSFDRLMATNVKGYWQCMQAALPLLKESGNGRIIIMSSVHSKRPTDFDAVYTMTKGAIRMLARESAIEFAKYGIMVNVIEPGQINVGRQSARESRAIIPDSERAKLLKDAPPPITTRFPLGRVGVPTDVAKLVCFLVDDENEFLSGSAIRLDGASMLM
jgi:NAD(P)-dependent dehydrogenase (short-subunit alcohol dehydrogenase family)